MSGGLEGWCGGVEQHDVTAPERRREGIADVNAEGIAIHRAVEHPWRGHAAEPQPGDEVKLAAAGLPLRLK